MLGIKIKSSDDNNESSVRPAVVSTEKRTDQWSVLLVSVGEFFLTLLCPCTW